MPRSPKLKDMKRCVGCRQWVKFDNRIVCYDCWKTRVPPDLMKKWRSVSHTRTLSPDMKSKLRMNIAKDIYRYFLMANEQINPPSPGDTDE